MRDKDPEKERLRTKRRGLSMLSVLSFAALIVVLVIMIIIMSEAI